MLVLSRKPSESVRIDERIVVTVVKSSGNRVQLAIDAPDEVPIMRGELLENEAPHDAASCHVG